MNLLRKGLSGAAVLSLSAILTGCAAGANGSFNPDSTINVLTREDGSGTRSAFCELFGLEEKQPDGTTKDLSTQAAVVTNSTSVMLTNIAEDPAAIGYVSLGSLNDTVKAVSIDGAIASQQTILDGSYTISRPFNVIVREDLSPAASDFLGYILSDQGQQVVADNDFIPLEQTEAYEPGTVSGKVVVSGSSSVTPVMEKLKEAYAKVQPQVEVEVQQSDSSTGISDAADGVADLGMASRNLKDSELEKGVSATTIALDGIAVIVNPENPVTELSKDQVRAIFAGESTVWSDVLQ